MNKCNIVLVVDASFAMGDGQLVQEQLNQLLAKQRQPEGEVLVTLVLFDDIPTVYHEHEPLDEIGDVEVILSRYTALLDAIGDTISWVSIDTVASDDPVFFITIASGVDNASQHFTAERVNKLIQYHVEEREWNFLLLLTANHGVKNLDAVVVNDSIETIFTLASDQLTLWRQDNDQTRIQDVVLPTGRPSNAD